MEDNKNFIFFQSGHMISISASLAETPVCRNKECQQDSIFVDNFGHIIFANSYISKKKQNCLQISHQKGILGYSISEFLQD